MKKERPTDDCISNTEIQRIHKAISQKGVSSTLDGLLERETALGAYVMFCGHQIAETVRFTGAPRMFVEWIKDEVMARLLVCIAAQHQASYDLWRDFMGDEPASENPTDRPDKSNGGDHGRN